MAAAWAAPRLTHTAKIVLLALADNANDAGVCWPSIPKIADRCSLDARTVSRAIAMLEGVGHLTTETRLGKATIYRVHPVLTPGSVPGVPLSQSHPCQPDTPVTVPGVPLSACRPSPDSVPGVETLPPAFSPSRALPLNLPPSLSEPSLRSGRAPARARSRTVPKDFEITEAMRKWAKEKAPNVDIEAQTERFRDHEFKDPHSDWIAAWRQWMRRAPEFQHPTSNGFRHAEDTGWKPPKGDPKYDPDARRSK